MSRHPFIPEIGNPDRHFASTGKAASDQPLEVPHFVVPLAGDEEYAQNWQFSGLQGFQRTNQPKLTSY
jgi:hypothetical protein